MSAEAPATPGPALEDAASVLMDAEAWLTPNEDAAASSTPSRSTVRAPAAPVLPPVSRAFELPLAAPPQVETPFASQLGSLGVVPLEGTSESRTSQQGAGGGSRELLLANRPANRRADLSSYYRVHRQHVVYVEGIGPTFIHLFTGTLYRFDQVRQIFATWDAWVYQYHMAYEYVVQNQVSGGVVDTRLPDRLELLPEDAYMPGRFLIRTPFGVGLGMLLGTMFPFSGAPLRSAMHPARLREVTRIVNEHFARTGSTVYPEQLGAQIEDRLLEMRIPLTLLYQAPAQAPVGSSAIGTSNAAEGLLG